MAQTPWLSPKLPTEVRAADDPISQSLSQLLIGPTTRVSALVAWSPQAASWGSPHGGGWGSELVAGDGGNGGGVGEIGGGRSRAIGTPTLAFAGITPVTRLFAKSDKSRADRKWMWLVPPCAQNSSVEVVVPTADEPGARLAALSYFAMVSPGAKLRHTLSGQPIEFRTARGSFLEKSWGYLSKWHFIDPTTAGNSPTVWRMCTDPVPNARCVGWRCGLEFKMPMRTAAVGWFVGLHA